MILWTFGDLRAFFQAPEPPSEDRFEHLWTQLERALEHDPANLDVWLSYSLEHLDSWPDAHRSWPMDTEARFDAFTHHVHPLHPLARHLALGEVDADLLERSLHHPNARHITAVHIECEDTTPPQLAHILNHPSAPSLTSLTFFFSPLTTEHVRALSQSPHLTTLEHLSLYGTTLAHEAIRLLATSPHLQGLRTLHLEPDFDDPHASLDALRPFAAHMPLLQTAYGEPHTLDSPDMPTQLRTSTHTTRSRVDALLTWIDEHWDFCVRDPDPRSPPDEDEDAENVMCNVTLDAHALDTAFDERGELVAPLTLHLASIERGMMFPTLAQGYHGAHAIQAWFAMIGLHLETHDPQRLTLHPETCHRDTALVRTLDALWELQEQWGVVTIACTSQHHGDVWPALTTPEKTPHGGLFWNEYDHRFDGQGELRQGRSQMLCVARDIVLFDRVFARHGLKLSWPESETERGVAELSDGR